MNGKTRLGVNVVLGLVITLALFLFLVRPTLNKISAMAKEEKDTRIEVHTLEQQIIAYNTAQSDIARAVNKNLIFSTIVNDKNLHIPIEELEEGARNTNTDHELFITRESLDEPVGMTARERATAPKQKNILNSPDVEEVPYNLTASNTSYSSLVNFVQYLEHLPHFTEIRKMNVSARDSDGGGVEVLANIEGVFIVRKNEVKN